MEDVGGGRGAGEVGVGGDVGAGFEERFYIGHAEEGGGRGGDEDNWVWAAVGFLVSRGK